MTEEQKAAIEEQWSIVNGTHDNYVAERGTRDKRREQLAQECGQEPDDSAVRWSLLKDEMRLHAKNANWGLFRSARFQMAELLVKDSRLRDALVLYLEICYLDLNGPSNTGGERDPLIRKMFPPFAPEQAFLAPGVLARMSRIVQQLGIRTTETKKVFDPVARSLKANLRLPVNPKAAWVEIERELFGEPSRTP